MTNQYIIKRLELGANESIRAIWRRWWLTMWWRWLLVVVAILLPFFLLYPLSQWPKYGPIAFVLLLVVGLGMSARWWWRWYGTVLVLTNRRIIDCDQRGLFDRILTAASFNHITDIHFRRKGVCQTMLGYGTIEYTILPGQTRIITPGLRTPAAICQAISQMAAVANDVDEEKEEESPAVTTVAELKKTLAAMRQELGPEHFARIIASIDPDYRAYCQQSNDDSPA